MVNTPIPHSLKSEAKKAAKILKEFTVANAKAGPDKLIPGGILLKAKGLAILTVARLGFLVTARAGSGIVIAKLSDDLISAEWSAPAAIGMAGLGGGFEIGAEVTDFVIILNSRAAVEAFSKGGNLTLGGNFSIAAGPLGRNIEADVAVRSPAAIYTYSKTKGLFAGISIEGSGLIERKDANKKFYGRDIRAYQILSGEVDPPEDCAALYEVLEIHRERAQKAALNLAKKQALKHAHHAADKGKEKFHIPSFGFRSKEGKTSPKSSEVHKSQTTVRTMTKSHDNDVPSGGGRRGMVRRTVTTHTTRTVTHTGKAPANLTDDVWEQTANKKAVALFPYKAHLPCDLTFDKGDEIEILQMTQTNQDWWEGKCHGKIGIFPANYVKVA